ncbi:MAG: amidohydrolase family protein [Deltaproteobacteria bacterium]|nr:amidohydrolase family protein [Deltaproteobacteria bacterium]MBW2137869.1 amidohydrolase family protein [Deltaproteobacteria bacterium]
MKDGFDLLVKGGLVVGSQGIDGLDIAIKDGTIVKLARDLDPNQAEEVIDASGRYVLPGLLDVHVHPVYEDSIRDCSILGAFGGITTVIHYAYARPGMELANTVREFIDEGEGTSHTDFAIHGAMFDPENQIKDIPKCFEMGVTSFKMFMTYAKLGWMTDDYHLAKAMDVISQQGGLAMVHAEDGLSIDYLEDKFRSEPQKEVFLKVRPGILEADATFRAISIARVMNCPLYIVHVSARQALGPIRDAREQGQRVYTETCPQYLCLTDRDLQEKGPLAKIGPPLRTTEDNDALWAALKTGLIDVIASDHAPKAKKIDDDFFEAPFGSPSSETMLAVTYQRGINEGRLDLCTLVRAMSESPARIFGLYPRKGALKEGSDADLLVFDASARHRISQGTQHSKAGYTLYEGMDCLGKPIMVMQRGKIIVDGDALKSSKGQGNFLETKISDTPGHLSKLDG